MALQSCNKGTKLKRLWGVKVNLNAKAPTTPVVASYRITEDGDYRITEDGNYRII